MKAALIIPHAEHGGRIELREVDKPQPKAGEVLVRIEATAINRGEIGPRKAHRSGEPRGSGVEFAGEVVGLGEGATASLGQAVMGHCVTGPMSNIWRWISVWSCPSPRIGRGMKRRLSPMCT